MVKAWLMLGRRKVPAGMALLVATLISPVGAFDRHWGVNSGVWAQQTSWAGGAVPGPSDNAFIDYYNGAAGLARITNTAIGAVTSVTVTNGGTVLITNQGSLLCGTDFVVGRANNTGALNLQTNDPNIGFPGGLTIASALRLGVLSGVGQVNHNAGTVRVGTGVTLGDSLLSGSIFFPVGTYNLSGGGVLRSPSLYLGYGLSSTGVFNLSGFAAVQTDYLAVGGIYGTGSVNQTGGQMVVSGRIDIGSAFTVGSYTLSSGGLGCGTMVIFDGSTLTYNGGTTSLGDVTLLSGRIVLSSGGNKLLRARSLDVRHPSLGSVVDLSDNDMILDANNPLVLSDVARGYNGGAWTGDGITSSAAAAVAASGSLHRTALGVDFFGRYVKYTWAGDADLDGDVDITDLGRLASAWQHNSYWGSGDFNYDDKTDIADLGILASNWQQGVGNPLGPSFADALASFGLPASSLPEPCILVSALAVACSFKRPARVRGGFVL